MLLYFSRIVTLLQILSIVSDIKEKLPVLHIDR